MRRFIILIIAVITLLSTTGCKNYIQGNIEINNLEFVQVIAIDKAEDKEDFVKLTITEVNMQAGGDSEQKTSATVCSEAKTVSEAIANYQSYLDKKPFYGHLDFILIGEEAAKSGILKYLDFFSRDHEIRLNSNVIIVKGSTAEDVLKTTNKKNMFVHDRLSYLYESLGGQPVVTPVDLVEVMYILDSKVLSLYVPTIQLVKKTYSIDEQNALNMELSGFAVFNEDKLAYFLDEKQSRGLVWLQDKVISGIVQVESQDGNPISLEIIEAKVKKVPKIIDGHLQITVKVEMGTNIAEMAAPNDIFNEQALGYLNMLQEQKIKEEIESTLSLAQERKMDFFSTGSIVMHKYPILWQDQFEENWKEIFPEIEFKVEVKGKIYRTYNIKQPNRYNVGE